VNGAWQPLFADILSVVTTCENVGAADIVVRRAKEINSFMPGKYIFPDYRARLAAGLPATWPTIDVQRMPQKKEPGSRPGRDEFRPASTNGSRTGTTCRTYGARHSLAF